MTIKKTHQAWKFGPVGDGPGLAGLRRGVRDMHLPAPALHGVPVVLGGLRHRFGQVGDLMGVLHAQVTGAFQVSAAGTGPLGVLREGLIGVVVPFQVGARPRRAACRASASARRRASPAQGGFFPGWSSPLGAIDELPEFRDSSRSSRASFLPCSASSAFVTRVLRRSSAFSACSRVFASCSAAATPGASGTCALHHSRPSVSKSILTGRASPVPQRRPLARYAAHHTTLDRPAARQASTPAVHAANAAHHAVTRTYTQIRGRRTRPPPVRTEGRPECLRAGRSGSVSALRSPSIGGHLRILDESSRASIRAHSSVTSALVNPVV